MNKKDFWQERNEKDAAEVMKSRGFKKIVDDQGNTLWREPAKVICVNITGRPNRDTVINDNDIINLKIQMEISPDLDTFLKEL